MAQKVNLNTLFSGLTIALIFSTNLFSLPFFSKNGGNAAATEHPKLFFNADEINNLRQKAQTTHAEIWAPIIDYAQWHLDDDAPPVSAPDEGQTAYRNYANRLIPFAFSAVITDADSIKNFVKSYLLTLASWDQWGNKHTRDLALAHMILANSLAYDWLYSELTENERQIIRSSLGDWAEKMYEASSGPREMDWGNWWRKSYMQNHHWINNSALGIAGILLLDEDNRAQKWLDQATDQMERVKFLFDGIGDGSWHESMHYQSYGLTLSLPFLYSLKQNLQIDLLPQNYLKNYTDWKIYNYLPGSKWPIFSHGDFETDWGIAYPPQNILRFIAAEYQDQHAEWMAQKIINTDGRYANQWRAPWYVFEFLYYEPAVLAQAPQDMDLTAVFPDFTGVIWRTSWADDALVFGFKTGAYGGLFASDTFIEGSYPWERPYPETGCQLNIGHNHDDTNSFYLYGRGTWLANESEGNGDYESSLHNTILIDGQSQYRPPATWKDANDFEESSGALQAHFSSANYNFISADATNRYKNTAGITKVSRDILFVKPDYFLIFDQIQAESPHIYEWISHFGTEVGIEGNWIKGEGEGEHILGVGILSPTDFTVTTGNDGKPFARIRPTNPGRDTDFITILNPTTRSDWPNLPDISLVTENEAARLIKVVNKSGAGWFDHVISAKKISGISPVSQYQSDAQYAIIRRDNSGALTRLLLNNGTYLKDDSRELELVVAEDHELFIDIDYAQATVHLLGHVGGQIRLFGPAVNTVISNGNSVPFGKTGDFIIINADQVAPLKPKGIQIEVKQD